MAYQYRHVALGGTFDLFHKGHQALIAKAFKISKLVSIGITTDKFCQSSGKTPYESQAERRKNLTTYLKSHHQAKRVKIVWLNNIWGTTINDKTIEALVISKETLAGARKINKKRTKNKLKNLKIITVPQVLAQDGKKISTGRIKSGEISPDGLSYLNLLLKIANKRFKRKIRTKLKKPFGPIIAIGKNQKLGGWLITVGDITTAAFLKNRIIPNLAIVDFLVHRQRAFGNLGELGFNQPNPDVIVKNPPGQISKDLILEIEKALRRKFASQIILVEGEEDLAVIPTVLLSPLNTTVFYGQPQKGAVKVVVTKETKQKLCSLLS